MENRLTWRMIVLGILPAKSVLLYSQTSFKQFQQLQSVFYPNLLILWAGLSSGRENTASYPREDLYNILVIYFKGANHFGPEHTWYTLTAKWWGGSNGSRSLQPIIYTFVMHSCPEVNPFLAMKYLMCMHCFCILVYKCRIFIWSPCCWKLVVYLMFKKASKVCNFHLNMSDLIFSN